MRRIAPSLIALLAAAPALAEDVYAQAPVTAVTVYSEGAQMLRRAEVELPVGAHRIYLPYPGSLDLQALPRLATSEGVTIGAVGFRPNMRIDHAALYTPAQAEARAHVDALQEALAAQGDTLAEAQANVTALAARRDFLTAVKPGDEATAEELIAMADMLRSQIAATDAERVAAAAALRPITEQMDEVKSELAAAELALARLVPPAEVSDMLEVAVEVAEAGPVALELTEFDYAAQWMLDYDMDLDREAGALDIARKLIVTQETGSAWSEVALTLSTARLGMAIGPTEVWPDQARIAEAVVYGRAASPTMAMDEVEMAMEAPEILVEQSTKAIVQVDGLSITYVYPTPVTIAPKEAVELALDEIALGAEPAVHASPRHDETAFTVATFTNTTPEPLLPGWANVLRDGHLVGRETIEMIPAGAEVTLPFGAIEGLRLETVFERNEEGDTGILTRSNTREQRVTFSVENLTGEAQDVRAFFPLTFSEQEDLEVEVTATPAPTEVDIDKKRGVSAWDLAIAPGETAEVSIVVELDWPDGQMLNWYP